MCDAQCGRTWQSLDREKPAKTHMSFSRASLNKGCEWRERAVRTVFWLMQAQVRKERATKKLRCDALGARGMSICMPHGVEPSLNAVASLNNPREYSCMVLKLGLMGWPCRVATKLRAISNALEE